MSRSRYKEFYNTVVRADLLSKMQYKNVHQIPRVTQIAVSVATTLKPSGLDNPIAAAFMVELVTGQRAQLTRIKIANARYKVREGFLEGAKTQLHGEQMYDFMDKLVTTVLPRVTDFNGLKGSSFDGKGNFSLGITDWSYFLELEAQHANLQHLDLQNTPGIGVVVRTSAQTDDEARLLLSALRFPFRR